MFSYLNTRNQIFSPKNITVPLVTKKFSFASERREGGRGGRRVEEERAEGGRGGRRVDSISQ